MFRKRRSRRRPPPGSSPGILHVDPEAPPGVIRVMAYGPDGMEEGRVENPAEIGHRLREHPVVWVNVDGLGDAGVISGVGDVFSLHRLAVEDVVNVGQRPKVEAYEAQLFSVIRVLRGTVRLEVEQVSLFLGSGFVVTFQEREGDCFDSVRERIRQGRGQIRSCGADYLAYALVDAVVDHYFPVLEAYGERLEALEDEILREPRPESMSTIHAMRRDLLQIRRAVWPLREALNTLVRDPSTLVADETRLYLRDCYDHTIELIDFLETYREIAGGLVDSYLSILSHRMNEVMKVLTIIATIFIPLTFIAGVYGMNFEVMPELRWRWGYPAVMLLMAGIGVVLVLYFRRKGWLGTVEVVADESEGEG